jgi:hypothetical protein
MIRLHITPDGAVRGLWADEVDLPALGPVRVRRASYVEFDQRRQRWCVREAWPRALWRRVLQGLLHRPLGRRLHTAAQRSAALAWERENLEVGCADRSGGPRGESSSTRSLHVFETGSGTVQPWPAPRARARR